MEVNMEKKHFAIEAIQTSILFLILIVISLLYLKLDTIHHFFESLNDEVKKMSYTNSVENKVQHDYSASLEKSEIRGAMLSQLTHIVAMAQNYYRLPKTFSGGGGSFSGFEIPTALKKSKVGTHELV